MTKNQLVDWSHTQAEQKIFRVNHWGWIINESPSRSALEQRSRLKESSEWPEGPRTQICRLIESSEDAKLQTFDLFKSYRGCCCSTAWLSEHLRNVTFHSIFNDVHYSDVDVIMFFHVELFIILQWGNCSSVVWQSAGNTDKLKYHRKCKHVGGPVRHMGLMKVFTQPPPKNISNDIRQKVGGGFFQVMREHPSDSSIHNLIIYSWK